MLSVNALLRFQLTGYVIRWLSQLKNTATLAIYSLTEYKCFLSTNSKTVFIVNSDILDYEHV